MNEREMVQDALTKVPAVTLGFWIIKILATTFGETAGDSVSMTWNPFYVSWWTAVSGHPPALTPNDLGYIVGSAFFGVMLIGLVIAQIRAKKFHPALYWATIVASTTLGTTMADFSDRSLGIGYPGGSLLLFSCVLLSLFAWYRTLGSVDVNTVAEPKAEGFYWLTITFSQTLGTALGDWVVDAGLGYTQGTLLFSALLAVLALLYFTTNASRVGLFWAAFILTRPLGATLGNFLDKSAEKGGLGFTRPEVSLALGVAIVVLIWLLPQRAGRHPGSARPVEAAA